MDTPLLSSAFDSESAENINLDSSFEYQKRTKQWFDQNNDNCINTSWKKFTAFWKRYITMISSSRDFILTIYALCLLISSCLNAIFFKKMTNAMPNYGWFLSQITCIIYIPIFGFIIFWSKLHGQATEHMESYPLYKFGIMGFFDCLYCFLSIIGGAFTSGPSQLVLNQLVIPVSLILSTIILKHRYHFWQFFGSFIILLGILIGQSGRFSYTNLGLSTNNNRVSGRTQLFFEIIFATGCLPNALSQIYKEHAFRQNNLNVNYMQFYVAVFQILFGLITLPFNSLPFFGTQQVKLESLPTMVLAAFKCLFLRENKVEESCGELPSEPLCDHCKYAWIPVLLYILFNILYNVFTLLVVKYSSASLCFIVATLRLPLTTICFYSKFIMKEDAVSPKLSDLSGLFVLITGLLVYRYGSNISHKNIVEAPIEHRTNSIVNNDFEDKNE